MRMLPLLLAIGCPTDDGSSPPPPPGGTATTGDTGPPPDPCGPPTYVLGVNGRDHEPLTEGAPVVLVRGPQGGWHVDLTGEVRNVGFRVDVSGVVTLTDDSTRLTLEAPPLGVTLMPAPDRCGGTFTGVRLFVARPDDSDFGSDLAFVCSLGGRPLQVRGEIRTPEGATLVTEIAGVVSLDPYDSNFACPQL